MQFLEQPADVVLVVADAELLLDDLGDAGTGPDLAAEAVRLRAVPEELRDQTLLSGRELGRASGTGAGAQGLRAAVADTSEPTADAHRRDAQRLGDVPPRPALAASSATLETSATHARLPEVHQGSPYPDSMRPEK